MSQEVEPLCQERLKEEGTSTECMCCEQESNATYVLYVHRYFLAGNEVQLNSSQSPYACTCVCGLAYIIRLSYTHTPSFTDCQEESEAFQVC